MRIERTNGVLAGLSGPIRDSSLDASMHFSGICVLEFQVQHWNFGLLELRGNAASQCATHSGWNFYELGWAGLEWDSLARGQHQYIIP